MKRAILSILCLALSCAIALCAVNKTLLQAQTLYDKASTVAEYQTALKKFKSATTDPNYEPSEHKAAIDKGISDCNAKINQLSASLTVSPSSISFAPDGGSYTLSVSTNQGTPSVSTGAGWLTVDSRSSTSITLRCSANSTGASRTATVTITAGSKSARVTATQQTASLVFTGAEFGSTDYEGNQLIPFGSRLYKDQVCYVKPRISYISDCDQTKTVYYKWYWPDGTMQHLEDAPSEYTQTQDVAFTKGTNTFLAYGLGYKTPGNYAPGTYKVEAWIDGKCLYTASFEIVQRLTITKIEFGSCTNDGEMEVPFGANLYDCDVRYLKPRIYYTSSEEQTKTIYVKIITPNGSTDTGSSSPSGYTFSQTVTFYKGTNTLLASGWGRSEPGAYSPGTYRYEIWIDGSRIYSCNFVIY